MNDPNRSGCRVAIWIAQVPPYDQPPNVQCSGLESMPSSAMIQLRTSLTR